MDQDKVTKMVKATLLYQTAVEWPDELELLALVALVPVGFDLTVPVAHPQGWPDGVDDTYELNWVWEAIEYYKIDKQLTLWIND